MSKKLTYLVIHCTDTPEGRAISAEQVRQWHTNPVKQGGRGWKQVGYSKLLLLDGSVHSFVNEDEDDIVDAWEVTNGVAGINSISRHICYVGGKSSEGKPKDTRTDKQKEAMIKIVKDLVAKYPTIKVAGHYNFAAKDCPCFNVQKWCKQIGIPNENIYKP